MKARAIFGVLFLLALALSTAFFVQQLGPSRTDPKGTHWLGMPVAAKTIPASPLGFMPGPSTDFFYEDDYEVGLRPDGVMVWRKKQ